MDEQPTRRPLKRVAYRPREVAEMVGMSGAVPGTDLALSNGARGAARAPVRAAHPHRAKEWAVSPGGPGGRGPSRGVRGYLIASGYGARAQWFCNILDDPRVCFQVGWRRYAGLARPLPATESGRRLAEYARRHPRLAASLMKAVGQDVDGSAAAYKRVGSDREHGVPIVALQPQ